jgi:4-hydroxy-tetrahydrodipicolinate reductase
VNYALVGYGKMGHAIEAAAAARGHVLKAVVDHKARGARATRTIDDASWRGIKLAFEFTSPHAAKDNVIALLRRNVSVVCGTTGWDAADPELRRAARGSEGGAVIAANFSIGVNMFYALVSQAAQRYLTAGDYDPWVAEWHHRAKVDAPSGTARHLATLATVPAKDVAFVRAGHEPGRHVVGFDGRHDAVRLEHVSRGREGLAAGAVLAAEWLLGRRGLHGFDEVLNARGRGRKRGLS